MDLKIAGRVALVGASTGGLGLASARALAAEGCQVVISGRRAHLAVQLAGEMDGALAVPADFREPGAADALVDATMAGLGPVDILVLNGPGPAPGSAADLEPADLDAAFATLVEHQVRLVRRTLPGMRERGWGRIVSIASSGVRTPLPNLAASNAGRAALTSYLKTLAGEVAGEGVTINTVLPGRISTDRVRDLDRANAERRGVPVDEVRSAAQASIPAGRYGSPDEFGAVVAFLAGSGASYVTGATICCDGGLIPSL